MESIKAFFHMVTSPEGFRQMIAWGGYFALAAIVFAETGLLVGFFLPGDSLLVTAGLLASTTDSLNIVVLNLILIPMAVLGDAVGYMIGRRSGEALMRRPDSRLFKRSHLEKTQAFYAKHGGKTIIFARFVPIIRTFAPTVAGIAKMPYREFATYNIVGGALWVLSTTLLGYFLGRMVPNIEKYLHFVIAGVVVLSLLPPLIQYMRRFSKPNDAELSGVSPDTPEE